jgi:hypothetical protein
MEKCHIQLLRCKKYGNSPAAYPIMMSLSWMRLDAESARGALPTALKA